MANFKFISTGIEGLTVVEPAVFADDRGYFMETYVQKEYEKAGIPANFVQDNQSSSTRGVLRGIHFQKTGPQGKLVRVLQGEVFDVAVDLRPQSATFGSWYGIVLSAENKKQMFVPAGFGHGFLVMSDTAEFTYKCTAYYNKQDEGGVPFDDAAIGIEWPDVGCEYILSDKDRVHVPFNEQKFDYYNEL